MTLPKVTLRISAADEPLLNRVPTRDEHGKALSDLMVLVPGLREKPNFQLNQTIQDVHNVLERFATDVVFAEIIITRNMLWVSVRPTPGIRVAIASALRERVPEAKLVAHF
ncbi:MAG: hypothetical protein O3C28_15135 [Proteobacteria bacterium]|nr:hypothetical protein [Pseudomonadota bacterium]